jgi:penicillin-binding protein 1C
MARPRGTAPDEPPRRKRASEFAAVYQTPRRMKTLSKKILKAGAAVFILPLVVYLTLRLTPYPALERFLARPVSTRVYDRNGILLQIVPLKDGIRREYVPLDGMKRGAAAVFITAEDRRFYGHFGVDVFSIIRAATQNLSAGRRVSGASTVTMQLARIVASGAGKTYRNAIARKAGESVNALRLEARFTKDEILEMYLNSTPFGFQTEGLASAARNFFAVEADMLTPAQIFCLAVIPRRPSAYNPITNPDLCAGAAKDLWRRFSKSASNQKKYPEFCAITDADWEFALENARRFEYPFEAPHLVRYVLENSSLPDLKLSVDIYLQRYIEALIAENVARYRYSRLNQGAAIALDNKTGEILAWVGSAGFDGGNGGQIDGALALNQPGSSMKPFLYALALESGIRPDTVLADVPVSFGSDEVYIPQNFNNRFNGPVLLRQALSSSLNIPAVKLLYRLGVKEYCDFLVKLGFDSLDEGRGGAAGLGLALGNAPVSLFELARAFSVFPNDGYLVKVKFTPQDGDASFPEDRVISPDTARIICSFLSDKDARYLAFGRARNFSASFPLIVKTGTANQYQSIVALAASRRFTSAVWMGNFSGETVIGKTGSSVPAAVARDSLVFLRENLSADSRSACDSPDNEEFEEPEGFIKTPVCAVSGLAPTEACAAVLYEYLAPNAARIPCDWHSLENGFLTTAYPAEYQGWLLDSRREGGAEHSGSELTFVTPREGFVFFAGGEARNQAIPVEVTGGLSGELRVLYDGAERVVRRPFKFFLPLESGRHTLTARCGEESLEINFTVEK